MMRARQRKKTGEKSKKKNHYFFCCSKKNPQSLASTMPSGAIAKVASLSGREGLATILAMRCSPRPFLSHSLVVDACAWIFFFSCFEKKR